MTTSRFITLSLLALVFASIQNCRTQLTHRESLRRGAAALCDRHTDLWIWLRTDGRYSLNTASLDSAQLVRALETALNAPRRLPRVVMVKLDPQQSTKLEWLVPLIERSGGVAYEPDSACSIELPSYTTPKASRSS